MSQDDERIECEYERLARFLEVHDLHLLTDPTEAVSVGTIYQQDSVESKARIIGDVSNFIEPAVNLPAPKIGTQAAIVENLADRKGIGLLARISAAIHSFDFSIDTRNEKILEVRYEQVTFENIDSATFSDLFENHKLKINRAVNINQTRDSKYYLVTRVFKSSNFRIYMNLSKDLKIALKAESNQAIIEGGFRMEIVKGRADQVVLSYLGAKSLVFASHLEKIDFMEDGQIVSMKPLSQVLRLLDIENRFW